MREASLILPLADNDGADLGAVHAELQTDLIDIFGGYTAQAVTGGWRDETSGKVYADTSTEYRVAADWSQQDARFIRKLDNLAALYARRARQQCVYVRHASGEIAFCSPATHAAPRLAESEAA